MLLGEADITKQFPSEVLNFLDRVIGEDARWLSGDLKKRLDEISEADGDLTEDPRHVRLTGQYRRHGMT